MGTCVLSLHKEYEVYLLQPSTYKPRKTPMKSFFPFLVACALVGSTGLISCGDDETTDPNANQFVATDASFANYSTWTKVDGPIKGRDPAGAIGTAHAADDTTVVRNIYINNATATRGANGEFANGTVLVKDLRKADGTLLMITAMAKRGGDFNKSHKGWEWFLLDPASGKIASRADTLMGGMCNGCHAGAASKDYVFTK